MFHTIEFDRDFILDVEAASHSHLQQLEIKENSRFKVQLKPSVVETPDEGPIEVADLLFEDGTIANRVVYGCFRFVDED